MTPAMDCQSNKGVVVVFVALFDGLTSVGAVLSGVLSVIG